VIFDLGQTVATRTVSILAEQENLNLIHLLSRHSKGDWGDLCDEDKKANDYAIGKQLRIFSSYKLGPHKIWIITEADRSSTCIMLPEDY
jgi:hypothetical protein